MIPCRVKESYWKNVYIIACLDVFYPLYVLVYLCLPTYVLLCVYSVFTYLCEEQMGSSKWILRPLQGLEFYDSVILCLYICQCMSDINVFCVFICCTAYAWLHCKLGGRSLFLILWPLWSRADECLTCFLATGHTWNC